MDTFQAKLESEKVFAELKQKVADNQEALRECEERLNTIRSMINDGEEAARFKEQINALNPMSSIKEESKKQRLFVEKATSKLQDAYGDYITSKEEAKRFVKQFAQVSSDALGVVSAEMEAAIRREVMGVGEKILEQYQERIAGLDEKSSTEKLGFSTIDLIKGDLLLMAESVAEWKSDAFATEQVDDVGEEKIQVKRYSVKVGEEEEKIFDGFERVKVGEHKEYKEKTIRVKNPNKRGWFGRLKFWEEDEVDTVEKYYEIVDDYEEKPKFKTVMRDVYEERTERISSYEIKVQDLNATLLLKLKKQLEDGLKKAEEYARDQTENMKNQFKQMFERLDRIIEEKYSELDQFVKTELEKKTQLSENQGIIEWLEGNLEEINQLLDM